MKKVDFQNLDAIFAMARQNVVGNEKELVAVINFKQGLFDLLIKTWPIDEKAEALALKVSQESQKTISEKKLKAVKK